MNDKELASIERLGLLAEECGEVQQVIGKILRHGWASTHPAGGPDNKELLRQELADLAVAMLLVQQEDVGAVTLEDVILASERKNKWLHHNRLKLEADEG